MFALMRLWQAVSGYDEAVMAPLMDKAAKMNLAKRHPELMATANAANDHLAAEAKIASSITSAIKSRDKDALAVALGKAREVCVCLRTQCVWSSAAV